MVGKEIGRLTIKEAHRKQFKPKEDRIKYITTYDGHADMVERSIKKNWHLLQSDIKIGKLFKERPLFVYQKKR